MSHSQDSTNADQAATNLDQEATNLDQEVTNREQQATNKEQALTNVALLARADSIIASLGGLERQVSSVDSRLSEQVTSLDNRVARNATRIVALVSATVTAAVLTVVMLIALSRVAKTSKDIQKVNTEAARALCVSRNESSARQRELWAGIVRITQDSDAQPSRETLDRFQLLLDKAFITRDCNKPLPEVNR